MAWREEQIAEARHILIARAVTFGEISVRSHDTIGTMTYADLAGALSTVKLVPPRYNGSASLLAEVSKHVRPRHKQEQAHARRWLFRLG